MKPLKHLKTYLPLLSAVLLSILCGFLIGRAPDGEYAALCILLVAAGAAVALLLYVQERTPEQSKPELPEHPKDAQTTAPEKDELLRKKCDALETFRGSFPYKVHDGYVLYNIMRTELQVSAYSRWQLVGEYDGQLWELSLLRPDTQSYRDMLRLASSTKTPQELSELNQDNTLLWD